MRMLVIAKRVILQILYDKRTLALMMVAPLLILSLVYALFDTTNSSNPVVGVYKTKKSLNEKLIDNDIKVVIYKNSDDIDKKITDDKLNAFIEYSDNTYNITYENFDISNKGKVKVGIALSIQQNSLELLKDNLKSIEQKMKELNPNLTISKNNKKIEINESYLYLDKNADFFDTISPILITFFVFFFVFIIAGISFINEKTTGTLERLLATPLKRYELVLGYFIGYGIFVVLQTIIIILFALYILGMPLVGNLGNVILINIATAFCALSLGLLLSSFARSEFQMMQFIPIIIIPQIFFSGIIDVSTMAEWLQKIAHLFPLFYSGNSLQNIMVKGYEFNQISNNLLILILFIVIFTTLNILALKKYRRT